MSFVIQIWPRPSTPLYKNQTSLFSCPLLLCHHHHHLSVPSLYSLSLSLSHESKTNWLCLCCTYCATVSLLCMCVKYCLRPCLFYSAFACLSGFAARLQSTFCFTSCMFFFFLVSVFIFVKFSLCVYIYCICGLFLLSTSTFVFSCC